jgi:hypothetical protein
MIPVLLSEQSLSHALEDNCSAYRVLWKWHWYLKNFSFYKTKKIMQHTAVPVTLCTERLSDVYCLFALWNETVLQDFNVFCVFKNYLC